MATLKRIANRALYPIQLLYWRLLTPQAEGAKVLIECEGTFLLVREAMGSRLWTLPGGRAKNDEALEDTARRRAKEEAGVELTTLTPLGTYFHTRQHKKDFIGAFHAKVTSPEYKIDPTVMSEAGWFRLEEITTLERSESVDDVLELFHKQG